MPCDTQRTPGQSISDRKNEVLRTVEAIQRALVAGRVKAVVGPQGAIAFAGLTDADRNRVTDACIYRRIMATGSALARAEIAKAERLAGRVVDRQTVAQGVHSHDNGHHWHGHKG
jgi:hypothetical protein